MARTLKFLTNNSFLHFSSTHSATFSLGNGVKKTLICTDLKDKNSFQLLKVTDADAH